MSTALSPCAGIDLPAIAAAPLVPLVTGETVRYANLDLAASAPPLQSVVDHVAEVLPYYASVHRGAGYSSQVSTSVLERARDTVGRFLGARADDVVVFTRNTTDALNLLASAVPGAVLCLDSEHHANLLPWTGGPHHVLPVATTIARTLDDLRAALAATPVALVTLAGAGNVTGELLPLTEIAEIVHAAGARLAVDAAQLAPHRRVDIAATGIDYVALSGHKLYAPYGAGVLVGRRDWLDAAPPHLAGGGASRTVTTGDEVSVEWAPAPQRHEGGTPNVLGAAALAQACRSLDPVIDEIAPDHERALLRRLLDGLATVPGVHPLRTWSDSTDRVGVVAFTVDRHPAGRVASYLSAEHGIGVRDGKFCAHPLVDRLTGSSDGAVRASIGIGTTAEDVDRLLDGLRALTKRGARWDYAVVDGRWAPTPDPRDLDPLRLGSTPPAEPGAAPDGGKWSNRPVTTPRTARPTFHPDLRLGRFIPNFAAGPRSTAFARGRRVRTPATPVDMLIEDVHAPGVSLRIYRPRSLQGAAPALFWMHGGGYVMGSPEQDEITSIAFARTLGITVVAVRYRLAPTHPAPAAVEDAYAGLRWLVDNAGARGVDPARIAIGGASAGGGLTASLALYAHDRGEVRPAFQLLVYPMLDDRTVLRTDHDTTGVRVWTPGSNRFGWTSYLGAEPGGPDVSPYAAPARREDLTGLPPAWLGVGTLDLFHDEDLAYAERLNDSGVPCEVLVVPGAFHGFDALFRARTVSRDFWEAQVLALQKALFG